MKSKQGAAEGKRLNLLEAALLESLDAWERRSVCPPGDDLIQLLAVDVGGDAAPRLAPSFEQGAPERAPVVVSGFCESSAAPSSCGPEVVTRAPQSNLSPFTLPAPPDSMPRYCGGFDGGCVISYFGIWFAGDDATRSEFMDSLAYYKDKARSQEYDDDPVFVLLGGQQWQMLPRGTNGEINYRFQLTRGGVTLLLHQNPTEDMAGVRAQIGYEAIFGRDLVDVNADILRTLAAFGFDVHRNLLGRCDMQVTLALPFDFVQSALTENRIVSRVRSWNQYSRVGEGGEMNLESLTGGGGLQICMYDKLRECYDKQGWEKLEDLEDALGFEFGVDTSLTRVEFRFKRDSLRAFQLDSVEDFSERIVDVVEYLVDKWFRILRDKKVRGRENQQAISKEWEYIRYAFYATFCAGKFSREPLQRNRSKKIDHNNLALQALGCVSSALAYRFGVARLTFEEFSKEIIDFITMRMPEIYKGYLQKRAWFEVAKLGRDAVQFVGTPDRSPGVPF